MDSKINNLHQTNPFSENRTLILSIVTKIEVILIIIQTIIQVLDYEGIPKAILEKQAIAQFIITWIAFLIVIIRTIILKNHILSDNFIIFDWIIVTISVIEIVHTLASGKSIEEKADPINIIFRSMKIVRIIKILYFSEHWFTYEKKILKIFIETVLTIKYFFVLLFCVILVISFVGQNLFAYRIRFLKGTHVLDIHNGVPYVSNFESIYKSIVSIILIMEN